MDAWSYGFHVSWVHREVAVTVSSSLKDGKNFGLSLYYKADYKEALRTASRSL